MSYEWVGVVATAAVGITGIASTWLLARANRLDQERLLRMQHEEGRKTVLLDARREAYKALSRDLQDLLTVVTAPEHFDEREFHQLMESANSLSRSLADVDLLGNEVISQLAHGIGIISTEYARTGIRGNRERVMHKDLVALISLMRLVMAKDLGVETRRSMSKDEIEKTLKKMEEHTGRWSDGDNEE